ncbi:hypothetical protein V1512DRAFT_262131 [Lipomyces arxii]|uniref:uncharacterized protein n=1 Tax=Lipomyces arxii TaxID=56418 RepID=UPI0034CDF0AD
MGLPIWRATSPSKDIRKKTEMSCVNTHRRTAQPLGSLQRYIDDSTDPPPSNRNRPNTDEDDSNLSSPQSSEQTPSSASLLDILQSQSLYVMGRNSTNVASSGNRGYAWWRSHRADLEAQLDSIRGSATDVSTGRNSAAEDQTEARQSERRYDDRYLDRMLSADSYDSADTIQDPELDLLWLQDDRPPQAESAYRRMAASNYERRLNAHQQTMPSLSELRRRRTFRRRRQHPSVWRDQNGNAQTQADDADELLSLHRTARRGDHVVDHLPIQTTQLEEDFLPFPRIGRRFAQDSPSHSLPPHAGAFDGLGDRIRSPSPGFESIDSRLMPDGQVSSNASIACEPGDEYSNADSTDVLIM